MDDLTGRHSVQDGSVHRHFVLSGSLGVGKRSTAQLLTQALSIMDPSFEARMEEDYKSFGGTKPAACEELQELLGGQLGHLDTEHSTKRAKHKVGA